MRRRWSPFGLIVIALLFACGEAPTAEQSPTSVAQTTTPVVQTTALAATTTTLNVDGVTIEAVGTVVEDRRGVVLCPFQITGPCPGLPLAGDDLPNEGDQLRITGRYDGRQLTMEATAPWQPEEFGPLFNPCTGNTNRIQPSEDISQSVTGLYDDMPDRIVGMWVSDGQIVVAFTGESDDATDKIAELDGVCVVTGYEYSARDLLAIVEDEVMPLLYERGLYLLFPQSQEVPEPMITLEGDAVDASTIEVLTETFGGLVRTATFITVLDGPVSSLPDQQPAVPGDIPLPTAAIRSGATMDALMGGAVLEYDADLDCLYFDQDDERGVIVWPFGYTAVSGDPVTVHDASGEVAFRTGVEFEVGGGGGSIEGVDPELRCGATGAWYAGGPTDRQIKQWREG